MKDGSSLGRLDDTVGVSGDGRANWGDNALPGMWRVTWAPSLGTLGKATPGYLFGTFPMDCLLLQLDEDNTNDDDIEEEEEEEEVEEVETGVVKGTRSLTGGILELCGAEWDNVVFIFSGCATLVIHI